MKYHSSTSFFNLCDWIFYFFYCMWTCFFVFFKTEDILITCVEFVIQTIFTVCSVCQCVSCFGTYSPLLSPRGKNNRISATMPHHKRRLLVGLFLCFCLIYCFLVISAISKRRLGLGLFLFFWLIILPSIFWLIILPSIYIYIIWDFCWVCFLSFVLLLAALSFQYPP